MASKSHRGRGRSPLAAGTIPVEHLAHPAGEGLMRKWFLKERDVVREDAASQRGVTRIPRHIEHADIWPEARELFGQGRAAHFRHYNVAQDEVNRPRVGARGGERLLAVA